jgi:hypothetical protein
VPDDDVVRRVVQRGREEQEASARSRQIEEQNQQQRELDFVRSVRAATPALLQHCESDLRPYYFIVTRTVLFRKRYESVDAAVWIFGTYSYTIGMREEHKTNEFGLTHEGVLFDTSRGRYDAELSDQEAIECFMKYTGAVQRVRGLCKKAKVTLPEFR